LKNIHCTSDSDRLIIATESLQAAKERQKSLCFICERMIPKDSSKRRLHIGKHILKTLRQVAESPTPVNTVSSLALHILFCSFVHIKVGDFPCGTCGKSTSLGTCAVTVTNIRGSSKVTSNCPEFTGISYASALKGSSTTPCTNVPIACELCIQPTNSKIVPAVWRYNLLDHVRLTHPGHTQPSHFSPAFWELMNIPTKEQIAMGIPKEQIPPTTSDTPPLHEISSPCGLKRCGTDNEPSPRRKKSVRST